MKRQNLNFYEILMGLLVVFLSVSNAVGQTIMFDDFTYTGVNDPQLPVFNKWNIINGTSGPPEGAQYRRDNITFINDPANSSNKLMTLSTTVNGQTKATTHSRIETNGFEYFHGTYAARVYFSEDPFTYKDANIQTFYTIVSSSLSGDGSRYSELDFEYMAADKWGTATDKQVMYMTSWNRYIPEPWQAWKRYFASQKSWVGWHTCVVSCTDRVNVKYWIDGVYFGSQSITDNDGSSVYPRSAMQVAFANWIWNNVTGSSTANRTTTMQVDWTLFYKDTEVSPTQIDNLVASYRSQGVQRRNLAGQVYTTGTVNQAPSISITAPSNNAIYTAPASITINANASDSDGSVARVEFYNGTTLLGTDNSSPYSFTWSNVAAGTYSIRAVAYDNLNASSTATISVSVDANKAPTVSITSPANNATYTAPASITINANAADTDGSVTKVEFYNGTTLLGTDNSSPYSFTWTNVPAGTYTVRAVAYDNLNASATATVSVKVNPVVIAQSPYGGTAWPIPGTIEAENFDLGGQGLAFNEVTPANEGGAYRDEAVDIEPTFGGGYNVGYIYADEWLEYTVNVTSGTYKMEARVAATAAGKSFRVELDGATIATVNVPNTGDWQAWQTVTVNNISLPGGQKILRFYALTTDFNLDKLVFSTAVTNQLPSVTLTSPTNNASFQAPASVTLSANASDPDNGIAKVEFYNGATLLFSDNTQPYSYTWNNVAAGTYTITAKATDNAGAVVTSSAATITVNAANQLPSVTLTSPSNNASFQAPVSVTLSANASDPDNGIAKVEFYNGATLLFSDNTQPYSYTWNNVTAGTYTITAKATDNAGASVTSSAATITVNAANQLPSVTLTSPTNNASFQAPASVTLSANASDPDNGIAKVEFYNGATLLFSDNTQPYSYSWNNVAAGTYTITAKATDNAGAFVTSSAVTITVSPVTNNLCSNIPTYVQGGSYVAGSKVQVNGRLYECKPWPYSGWCNGAEWAYGPGLGYYWQDAWIELGACAGKIVTKTSVVNSSEAEALISSTPNPFIESTKVQVKVEEAGEVSVKVYDKTGALIKTLFEGFQHEGTYTYELNSAGLSANIYYVKLTTPQGVVTKKIIKSE